MPAALPGSRRRGREALPAWAAGLRLSRLADLETAQAEQPLFSTGWPALDRDLGGGLAPGAITECGGAPTASLGLTTLQHQLLLTARRGQQFTALIDAFDRFDPDSCPPPLRESLLWVRCEKGLPQALKAADLLVRDPNFGLLLLDLREAEIRALRRIPAQQWYRLQHVLREGAGVLVAFTPAPVIPSAATRLRFEPAGEEPRWTLLRHAHRDGNHHQATAM